MCACASFENLCRCQSTCNFRKLPRYTDKETEIRVCKKGLENFLQLRFAIELFHGMEEKGAGLVDQIAEPDFKRTRVRLPVLCGSLDRPVD